jgi:ribosomal protein L11 methyltransferase
MRHYPALDVIWTIRPDDSHLERVLAEFDDLGPTATDDLPAGIRVFLPSHDACVKAAERLAALDPTARAISLDVPDDDWAERSQASLGAVQVGRIVITAPESLVIPISRSMGFGTGHHASTRLCLALLQRAQLAGRSVADIGTGSGVLAIAASKLGASRVVAIDADPDALVSARENVDGNGVASHVSLRQIDLGELSGRGGAAVGAPFDVVLANLTGGLIVRSAPTLAGLAAATGRLILSGLMRDEANGVLAALSELGWTEIDRMDEDEWVGLALTSSPRSSTAN